MQAQREWANDSRDLSLWPKAIGRIPENLHSVNQKNHDQTTQCLRAHLSNMHV